jgi:hypothetical protein
MSWVIHWPYWLRWKLLESGKSRGSKNNNNCTFRGLGNSDPSTCFRTSWSPNEVNNKIIIYIYYIFICISIIYNIYLNKFKLYL